MGFRRQEECERGIISHGGLFMYKSPSAHMTNSISSCIEGSGRAHRWIKGRHILDVYV
jgi:hypothetical protein